MDATKKTFKVPARWMKPTVIGGYRIEPKVNPRCPTERVTKAWLFYRLSKDGVHISDHGDFAGAAYAAGRLSGGHNDE